jgi:hypothetical protein
VAGVLLLVFSKFMRSATFTSHDPAAAGEVQAAVGVLVAAAGPSLIRKSPAPPVGTSEA